MSLETALNNIGGQFRHSRSLRPQIDHYNGAMAFNAQQGNQQKVGELGALRENLTKDVTFIGKGEAFLSTFDLTLLQILQRELDKV